MNRRDTKITRVPRSRLEARAWYDTISGWYGLMADPFERNHRAAGLELLDPTSGEHIVDVGCGTGSALVSIARSVTDAGRALGVDLADGMCQITRQSAERAGVSERTDVVCGDAMELPFRDRSIDAIFMSFTLELFDTPDIPLVLDECKRALRPGGRVCVVSLSKRNAGALTALYERIHTALPRYVDCRPIYARQTLRTNGLAILDTRFRSMWGLGVEIVLATVPNDEQKGQVS